MSKTIVGFFDDRQQAENAREQLLSSGLDSSNIQLFSGDMNSSVRDNESFGDKIKNFFTHMGDWDNSEDSHYYAEGIRRGGTTMSVVADDMEIERVTRVLEQNGAVDINQRAEFFKESGFTNYDMNSSPLTDEQRMSYRSEYKDWEKNRGMELRGDDEQVLPVIEEKVNIEKRTVENGRVRIYTRVTETPVDEEISLRNERVEVERTPVNRPVQSSDMSAFKDGEIELRETSEEAVVGKEARVVEEVRVRRQAEERTEHIHETARRTDVEVDRSAGDLKTQDRIIERDRGIDKDLTNR